MKTPEPLTVARLYELCLQAKSASPGSKVEVLREELWAIVDMARDATEDHRKSSYDKE